MNVSVRWRSVGSIAGIFAVGLVALVAFWIWRTWVFIPDPPTRSGAIDLAIGEGGPKWPGTTIALIDQGETTIVVREWLGMPETRHTVAPSANYFGVYGDYGMGEYVQAAVFCAIPMSLSAIPLLRLARKTSR